ncbi:MAG TPA: hypothetical protein VHL59_18230 [Thermoanaerobaculia bacterium]|nr:hypothetical protein [Thermoanaerobaculia bacterium]
MSKTKKGPSHEQTRSTLALMIVALVAVLAIGIVALIAAGPRLGLSTEGIRIAAGIFIVVCSLAGAAFNWYFRWRR